MTSPIIVFVLFVAIVLLLCFAFVSYMVGGVVLVVI